MDPILIHGAVTALDQQRQPATSTRRPSRNVPASSTRPWRPDAARMLRRLADRLDN